MWLAIKEAAGKKKPPSLSLLRDQLGGTSNAILYRRLFEDHPEVERGSEEEVSSHFSRLQRAQQQWRDRDTTDIDRRRMDPRAQVSEDPGAKPPAWTTLGEPEPEPDYGPRDLKGMPQRIPGWFTGDAMDAPPPGYGTPPMSRRDPGATMRSPESPSARPRQQSMQDWINWLGTKGIVVDDNGMRAQPAGPLPHRPLTGPQIWQPFIGPTTDESYAQHLRELPEDQGGLGKSWRQRAKDMFSRRRSSVAVTDYIKSILVTAGARESMESDGWTVRSNSGGGIEHYSKQIGDNIHLIVPQPGGWIHNFAPANSPVNEWGEYEQMSSNPRWHDRLEDAVMSANGSSQVGFKANQRSVAIPDSSYHPERDEPTSPIGKMIPPSAKGKYQTLSSTWVEVR